MLPADNLVATVDQAIILVKVSGRSLFILLFHISHILLKPEIRKSAGLPDEINEKSPKSSEKCQFSKMSTSLVNFTFIDFEGGGRNASVINILESSYIASLDISPRFFAVGI